MSKIDLRLTRELGSFYALIVINIVVGAVAMAMALSYGIQGISAIVNAMQSLEVLLWVPLVAISLAVFGVAIRWLISSAEVFSDAQEIREDYLKKELNQDEGATLAIERTMALYRERKPLFGKMAWVSKVAGILLLGLATYGIFSLLMYPPLALNMALFSVASIAINLTIGGFAIYIPHLFSRLAGSWGFRLEHGEQVNQELKSLLEGSP